jgi:hypothetical protein
MALKRVRPASSVEEIDGRDDASKEEEQVLASDDEAERTMSDLPVPMEVEVVVAESSARRAQVIPQVEDFQRASLQLKQGDQAPDGRREQARCAPPPHNPGGHDRVAQQEAPLACGSLQTQPREGLDEEGTYQASQRVP